MIAGVESRDTGKCSRCGNEPVVVYLVARYSGRIYFKDRVEESTGVREVWVCEPCFRPAITERGNLIHVFP